MEIIGVGLWFLFLWFWIYFFIGRQYVFVCFYFCFHTLFADRADWCSER